MVAAVCLRNVHKVYNNTCVVNDLSLTIQPGENGSVVVVSGSIVWRVTDQFAESSLRLLW